MEAINEHMAVCIARIFLGMLFLLQGYDKVYKVGVNKVIPVYKTQLRNSGLPSVVITFAAYYTSWIELLGGLMLIAGFLKYYVLCALGIDLVMVAVAMGLIEPLWRMDFVFPRLALLLFLLLVPPAMDYFSLDRMLLSNIP